VRIAMEVGAGAVNTATDVGAATAIGRTGYASISLMYSELNNTADGVG